MFIQILKSEPMERKLKREHKKIENLLINYTKKIYSLTQSLGYKLHRSQCTKAIEAEIKTLCLEKRLKELHLWEIVEQLNKLTDESEKTEN